MILYALACPDGHRFDSWFRDSGAFDTQVAAGLVACPVCASTEVVKSIMAPAVVGARKVRPAEVRPPSTESTSTGSASSGTSRSGKNPNVALLDEPSRELRALVRQLRDKLKAEGHDVGRDFAREARRIHDGEAPHRQIYGQASLTEARDLLEDGITVVPLPIVPDDLN